MLKLQWWIASALCVCAATVNGVPKCDGKQWIHALSGEYNTSSEASDDAPLNVHLISHSHDDPGWLITVDQYFTQEVDYILDTAITELLKNPDRRFMFVEQAFFQRWWREQSKKTKQIVKQLVKEGRLDLSVNGGWVMHDEATPHYSVMVDQTALGHKFLKEEFGVIPRIGWQIDPFGHSSTQGSLLSGGIGFDALYFARNDYQDYDKRKKNKDLEFIWRPSASRGKSSQVFTGVMQQHYCSPQHFSFSNDQPIKDDSHLHDYNVCNEVDMFVKECQERAKWTKGKHIFLPMGCDFDYQNSLKWFKNLDKLIHYVNQDGRVNVFYSTLPYYTDCKHKEKLKWSVKTDDFFPYADHENAYWTGYFTSRPSLKRFARVANGVLQQVRHIEIHAQAPHTKLNHLQATVGLAQHHDGLSGTEKQAVADDYSLRMNEGVVIAEKRFNELLSNFDTAKNPYQFCLLNNISVCDTSTKHNQFEVLVYNPLPHEHTTLISIPVTASSATVRSLSNSTIKINSTIQTFTPIYANASIGAGHTLHFKAILPPLSFQRYAVALASKSTTRTNSITSITKADNSDNKNNVKDDIITLENQYIKATFSRHNGSFLSYYNKVDQTMTQLYTSLEYYHSHYKPYDENSGAYLFRPEGKRTYPLPFANSKTNIKFVSMNPVLQKITFEINSWGFLEYQLLEWAKNVQIVWTVGNIPIPDFGKEVILKIQSDIQSNAKWYTDSNGLEFVERKRNYRETWDLKIHNDDEFVTANYAPITTGVYIRGNSKSNNDANEVQLNVLTDRAQGAASLKDGELEIMIHRRLHGDDGRGVGESLNETESINNHTIGLTVRGKFLLSVGTAEESMVLLRKGMQKFYMEPLLALRPVAKDVTGTSRSSDMDSDDYDNVWVDKSIAGIETANSEKETVSLFPPESINKLPFNIGLTSIEIWCPSCILVRLTHLFAVNEHAKYSKPAMVDFSSFWTRDAKKSRISVEEMSLTANKKLKSGIRSNALQWDAENESTSSTNVNDVIAVNGTRVILQSMEVRAFKVCFHDKKANVFESDGEDYFADIISAYGN